MFNIRVFDTTNKQNSFDLKCKCFFFDDFMLFVLERHHSHSDDGVPAIVTLYGALLCGKFKNITKKYTSNEDFNQFYL